jgi:hypothetical protein
MTEKIKSEVISRRRVFSLLGLAIASGLLATIPVSPQVTPRGVELSVDQAQAVTYRRARVTARRVNRRVYRHTRRAVRRGVYSRSAMGKGDGAGRVSQKPVPVAAVRLDVVADARCRGRTPGVRAGWTALVLWPELCGPLSSRRDIC